MKKTLMPKTVQKGYTPEQAKKLGVFGNLSLRTIRNKCRSGEIPCENIGSSLRPVYLIPEGFMKFNHKKMEKEYFKYLKEARVKYLKSLESNPPRIRMYTNGKRLVYRIAHNPPLTKIEQKLEDNNFHAAHKKEDGWVQV